MWEQTSEGKSAHIEESKQVKFYLYIIFSYTLTFFETPLLCEGYRKALWGRKMCTNSDVLGVYDMCTNMISD